MKVELHAQNLMSATKSVEGIQTVVIFDNLGQPLAIWYETKGGVWGTDVRDPKFHEHLEKLGHGKRMPHVIQLPQV